MLANMDLAGIQVAHLDVLELADRLVLAGTADRLNVSTVTVRRLIRRRDLPAVQLAGNGSAVRVAEAELNQWLFRGGNAA
jgi:excisionase family DNA binding protein